MLEPSYISPLKDGILFVNKSVGCTSKDVSRFIEKKFPKKPKIKMGHVGTLDPMASGVLAIAIGKATKLQGYLLDGPKEYVFSFELGHETDSLDSEGTIHKSIPSDHVSEADVRMAVQNFPRSYEQVPPIYSAVKFKGKSLHKWARKGKSETIDLQSMKRPVQIYTLEIIELYLPLVTLKATVSKGTYVRCLARDLANNLGTCATVTKLERTEALGVRIEDAVRQGHIESGTVDELNGFIVPIQNITHPDILQLTIIDPEKVTKLRNGQEVLLKSAEFRDSLNESISPINTLVKKTLLLLSEDQNAFGIAQTQAADDEGWVRVRMSRGL